jgi:beta-1,4-mannosyltransferase
LGDDRTLFTERAAAGGPARLRADRPALLVSSTSWTEDEDFELLVRALASLDKLAVDEPGAYPDFVVCVTGKGPLRAHFEARFAELRLRRVHVRTLWLEAGDYPRLLGAADAGICLHTSSSGLDLPMKVRESGICLLRQVLVRARALSLFSPAGRRHVWGWPSGSVFIGMSLRCISSYILL